MYQSVSAHYSTRHLRVFEAREQTLRYVLGVLGVLLVSSGVLSRSCVSLSSGLRSGLGYNFQLVLSCTY